LPAGLFVEPGRYQGVPVYTLLEAVARGTIAVDHRFLHAVLDEPANAIPDLVRFAAEDHDGDEVDLEATLIDIFRHLDTPEALRFFIGLVRRHPEQVSDELVEGLVALGGVAVDALLSLLDELEPDATDDVLFVLAELGIRDPRILEALTRHREVDSVAAEMYLDIYNASTEGARETFDIWSLYPEEDWPDFENLSDETRLRMLGSGDAKLRAKVAASYQGTEPSEEALARLLDLAKTDPDSSVRGACWEALGEASNDADVQRLMLAVLRDPAATSDEKGGAAVALAQQSGEPAVYQAIESLYAAPESRARALQAMARSFDKRFAAYPPKHLDDPDREIRRQAIWGVAYLNLAGEAPRLTAFFEDEELRTDALFGYALSIPGETSAGRIRALLDKVEKASGGFRPDEEELVQIALDQRLMLHGKKPVFFTDDALEEPEPPPQGPKADRNDPCPCGSGKKFKKCCGV
jgi:hypothetical protein